MTLKKWLKHPDWVPKIGFTLIDVTENCSVDNEIKDFLNQNILEAYIGIPYLIRNYKSQSKLLLKTFLEKNILPSNTELYRVWQWDIWEIIAKLIVSYFRGLEVPATKLKLKTNKDRSVFWTDMISHDEWAIVSDWCYYEIKTKHNLADKNYDIPWNPRYITVVAHDSLRKDLDKNSESIATFLSKFYDEKWDYTKAAMYWDISNWKTRINRKFEIFIIWEKESFKDDIIKALENVDPKLASLNLTIVLIEWFKEFVTTLRNEICATAESIVYI